MPALLSSEKRTQILLTGIGTISLALAGVLWYIVQGMATQLELQGEVLQTIRENSKAHNEVAALHINQIQENKLNIQSMKDDVHARPDPFSGTQGRAMRAALEAKLDKMEERLDRLENNCMILQYRIETGNLN